MIDEARRIVAEATRLVTFSGAGLSAESGLSTFRQKQTGLWAKHDPMKLASVHGFAEDPEFVIDWYAMRRRGVAEAVPNAAHVALAARDDVVHVTQNVDDLLERAGASDVVHLHGSIIRDRCHGSCGHDEAIDPADPPTLRECPKCGAAMRPGVVWFGEALDDTVWMRAQEAVVASDVLIAIGTSAVVQPAAGLIALAKSTGSHVIVVNMERTNASGLADVELIGPAGEIVPALLA